MQRYRLVLAGLVAAAAAAIACGDGSTPSGDDDDDMTAPDAGGGEPDATPPPPGSYTLEWGPYTVAPGEEDTRCVVLRLGNRESLRVHQIHNVLGPVSHHFIVYRSNETEERREPFQCDPFVGTLNAETSPLMITQRFDETLTLPDGVAFVLEPNQMIRLELHYINATDAPVEARPTSTFIPLADGDFTDAADLVFMGDVDIDIPPMSTASIEDTYLSLPSELSGAQFFAITGHEHQWGTNVRVHTASGLGAPVAAVYDVPNFDWDEPDTVFHSPPFTVPDGGGFLLSCEWNNRSDQRVRFGESANDEMCFFWAYYYPSVGPRICFQTDQTGSPLSVCCPGSPLCSALGF